MYNVARDNELAKPRINIGLVIFILGILIFFARVITVLALNTERGGFAYVQLLNLGIPLVEAQIYDEGDYQENNMSIKTVCLEALGLSNISSLGIVNNEVSYFKQGLDTSDGLQLASIRPFQISDASISKVEISTNEGIREASLKKALDNSKPEVLIFHTHTMEAYAEAGGDTNDTNSNIVGVGEELAKELEYYGISVIHDKTNYSTTYTGVYGRSNEGIKKYFNKYGNFKMLIDLHRDGAPKNTSTANINGEDVARFMLVTAENSKRYSANKALADRIIERANVLYPGLTRGILNYNPGACSINHSMTDNSILLECGSDTNSIVEAKALAKYIARILAEEMNR